MITGSIASRVGFLLSTAAAIALFLVVSPKEGASHGTSAQGLSIERNNVEAARQIKRAADQGNLVVSSNVDGRVVIEKISPSAGQTLAALSSAEMND